MFIGRIGPWSINSLPILTRYYSPLYSWNPLFPITHFIYDPLSVRRTKLNLFLFKSAKRVFYWIFPSEAKVVTRVSWGGGDKGFVKLFVV